MGDIKSEWFNPHNEDIEKRNIKVLIVNRDCLYLVAGICVLADIYVEETTNQTGSDAV